MRFKRTLLLIIFITLGCDNPKKVSVDDKKVLPKDLNEAFSYLKKEIPEVEVNKFKNQSESDATYDWHMTKGLWMRNNWIRGYRDTALVDYFNRLDLYNPEDISAVIIRSFYRKLNNKDIDLKSQISAYTIYWKNISDCEKKAKSVAVAQYKKHGLNSPISILMAVDTSGTSGHSRDAVIYEC